VPGTTILTPLRRALPVIAVLLVSLLLAACDSTGPLPPGTPTAVAGATATVSATAAVATRTGLVSPTETEVPEPTAALTSSTETAAPTATLMSPSERRELFEKVWQTVKEHYLYTDFRGVDWDKARSDYLQRASQATNSEEFYGAVSEMVDLLKDQHSRYISPQAAKDEDDLNSGDASYAGIGILSKRVGESTMVSLVFPGSPAEEAGLKRRDRVIAIDGEKVEDDLGKIRGPAGTSVRLTVQSPGEEPRDLTLTRRSVTGKIVASSSRLHLDNSVAYLLIPSLWADDMSDQVEDELKKLLDGPELKGLIIDLRANEGGWRPVLTGILGQFVTGDVGHFYSQENEYPLDISQGDMYSKLKGVPVVVLVDGESQSYSEVLAATLQASGRAKVVGTQTAGNTETIYAYNFDDGSRLWVAQEGFKLPSGTNLEGRGVIPDAALDIDWTQYPLDADPQLLKAVELLK